MFGYAGHRAKRMRRRRAVAAPDVDLTFGVKYRTESADRFIVVLKSNERSS